MLAEVAVRRIQEAIRTLEDAIDDVEDAVANCPDDVTLQWYNDKEPDYGKATLMFRLERAKIYLDLC